MKTTRTVALASTCLAISLSANASHTFKKHHALAETPFVSYELKGLKLGSPISEAKTKYPFLECHKLPESTVYKGLIYPIEETCSNRFQDKAHDDFLNIAGYKIESIVFGYKNGALADASVSLTIDAFPTVVKAITAKYGKPASIKTVTYQNGYGAKFNYSVIKWSNKSQSIVANEYDPHPSDVVIGKWMKVDFATNQYYADDEMRKAIIAKQDAGSL